ncbi:hypothetical protein [Terrihalobacillus insolitus]|uniref:hypothetical protein n=1 Tax=Terrihalobacillus insolitus TaxID=2950438 RepID=UPI00234176B6|nr:hypothetical protein [Terrihalobacillus insolitus]MDC3414020.1 hypothetical protein [Terrihalobacillus insolitus]
MKNKNKFKRKQKVTLKSTGEIVTINDWSYVENMKRYSYTVEEYPNTFYFEEELEE